MNRDTVANAAKILLGLCRAGRLYEVEKWVAGGKPLDISEATSRGGQPRLLEIAVETGFYSLVELIAKHETSQSAKAAAYGVSAVAFGKTCRNLPCRFQDGTPGETTHGHAGAKKPPLRKVTVTKRGVRLDSSDGETIYLVKV